MPGSWRTRGKLVLYWWVAGQSGVGSGLTHLLTPALPLDCCVTLDVMTPRSASSPAFYTVVLPALQTLCSHLLGPASPYRASPPLEHSQRVSGHQAKSFYLHELRLGGGLLTPSFLSSPLQPFILVALRWPPSVSPFLSSLTLPSPELGTVFSWCFYLLGASLFCLPLWPAGCCASAVRKAAAPADGGKFWFLIHYMGNTVREGKNRFSVWNS